MAELTGEARGRWSSRQAFILAAIGSAIGLGNLIRFPYICAKHGGGAFLIAYVVAMITAGVPIMLLEFGLGHSSEGSAPKALRKVHPKLEWLGWIASGVAFSYLWNSANITEWAGDAGTFFIKTTLGKTADPFTMGAFQWPLFIGLVLTWIAVVASVWKGAKTASKVVYVTVFIPWVLLLIFVLRAVTLPGAKAGIDYYLTPVWEKLGDPQVWLAAYTQTFFSLSIGFGIMIAYSSFLRKQANLTKKALIICAADALTAIIGGFAVFGAAGWLAVQKGVPVKELLGDIEGLGLAFVTYPSIIAQLPSPELFGILFYLMLLTLGIDSAFSLLESVTAAFRDKWNMKHWQSNLVVGGLAFLLGLPLITGCGVYWIDTVDHFMNNCGLALVCLLECIVVATVFKTRRMRDYLNERSSVKLGRWWDVMIRAIAPTILISLLAMWVIKRGLKAYEGYPRSLEFWGGWFVVISIVVLSIVLSFIPWRATEKHHLADKGKDHLPPRPGSAEDKE